MQFITRHNTVSLYVQWTTRQIKL